MTFSESLKLHQQNNYTSMEEQEFSEEEIEDLQEVVRMIQLSLVLNLPPIDLIGHIVNDGVGNSTYIDSEAEDRASSHQVEVMSDKLEKACVKNKRLLEMYSAKVREVADLEERLSMSETELESAKNKLRLVEVELRFSRQCHGENAMINSLMNRLDIRPGQGLLGPGPGTSHAHHAQNYPTPPFVPRAVSRVGTL